MAKGKSDVGLLRVIDGLGGSTPPRPPDGPNADPALVGAKRERRDGPVFLGLDPAIKEQADRMSDLKLEIDQSTRILAEGKSELGDYGVRKLKMYNTICPSSTPAKSCYIPYHTVIEGEEREMHVMVTESSSYKVDQAQVLGYRDALGHAFRELFELSETRVLRADAVDAVKALLRHAGAKDEQRVNQLFDKLFITKTEVEARPGFEERLPRLVGDEQLRDTLSASVSRCAPAIKFPK
jgi:hypothetical protein